MNNLEGKVAIVTGSSKGIGAGIAARLAADGASIIVNYSRSAENAAVVVKRITDSGGKAAGAERFGWSQRHDTPGARREGEWLIGMGCGTGRYPYYRMPGGKARLTLDAGGHATVAFAAHEMGMGTATVQTQVAADRLLSMLSLSAGLRSRSSLSIPT